MGRNPETLHEVNLRADEKMEADDMLILVEEALDSVRFLQDGNRSDESPTIIDRSATVLHLAGSLIALKAGDVDTAERHHSIAQEISPTSVEKFDKFSSDRKFRFLFRNIHLSDPADLRLPKYLAKQIQDPLLRLKCALPLVVLQNQQLPLSVREPIKLAA